MTDSVVENTPPHGLVGPLLAAQGDGSSRLDRRAFLDRVAAERAPQEAREWRAARDDFLEHEPHRLLEPPGDRERRAADFADEVMDVLRSRRAARAARSLRRALRWAAINRRQRRRSTSGAPRPSVRRADRVRASSVTRRAAAALSAAPPGPTPPAAPAAALAAIVADVAALRAQHAQHAAEIAALKATVAALEARVAESDRTREVVAREIREADALARRVPWKEIHQRIGALLGKDSWGATLKAVERAKAGSPLHQLSGAGRTEGNVRAVEAALRGAGVRGSTCPTLSDDRTTRHGVRSGT